MGRELLIQCPDGQMRTVPLTGERISVGRSSTAELCFPEDAGLSRQHFAFECEGESWTVQDLGSKNGTFVNNIPLKARLHLKPGDRITAGHLAIVYAPDTRHPSAGVVVFDTIESAAPTTSTVVTSLEGALSNQTMAVDKAGRGPTQVQALIRAGQCLSENHPLEELFPLILDLSIRAVNAQRGVVMILEGDQLVPKAHKGEGFRISTAVRDRVLKEKSSVLVRDAQLDDAFRGRMSIVEHKVHTMMAVPLQTSDRIIGLIYLDSPFILREFTSEDLNLLTVMANVAAIRIEHARLAEIEEAERILKRDLAQAAEIQGWHLPAAAPVVAHADLAGYNAPCRTVGGDYYDFFPYQDGKVALALGDVSGKGMPASLMMMALYARVQVLAEDPGDLGACMTRLNKATCAKCPSNRFITFFLSVFEPRTGDLAFANAGHNPPILVRASGAAEMIEGGGPVLGILPTAPYHEQHVRLGVGDLLVIYSDGVTEATNPKEVEYGEDRLIEVLKAHRHQPARAIVDAVTRALTAWSAGAPPADDVTLLVAKRLG
jgi:serine phosphatase RsbU (regulator of sigma subunit)